MSRRLLRGRDRRDLIEGLDGILRRLGGTPRRWRTDRPGWRVPCCTDTGRLLAAFAAAAKHYGVHVDVCPPHRPQARASSRPPTTIWRSRGGAPLRVASPAEAQASLDRFLIEVADERPREGGASVAQLAAREGLGPLPELPFPAQIVVERMVGPGALVAFDGNRYSVPPGLVGRTVAVRARLGAATIEILAASGAAVATHRRAPAGAGQLIRTQPHLAELERAVLDAFTTRKPCRRKANRPPGATAQAAAARLLARPEAPASVVVDLRLRGAGGGREVSGAVYQQLREQLHYLTLSAAAEQLAIQLEGAEKSRPRYTQFLHDLLAVEVESVFELIAPGAPTTPVQGGPGRFGSWE